jgi:hypothetical protein
MGQHELVEISVEERRRIAGLARNPSKRIVSRGDRERPTRWYPEQVEFAPGFSYSGPGAWDRIASHIESGGPVYKTPLKHPPNVWGYVIFDPPTETSRGLYAKFELTKPGICGRSFHSPDHPTLDKAED